MKQKNTQLNMRAGLNKKANIQQRSHAVKNMPLQVIPLGGCGEFGLNMTCYILGRKFIVADVGSIFSEPKQLGVSSIIPSVKKTFHRFGHLLGYFITHGHEDHIGSLPYVYEECPAPVYATPWTAELIKKKFKRYNLNLKNLHIVTAGKKIACNPFLVEYVHVNHSIPDATALFIQTTSGKVFHTGDFKVDKDPPLKKYLDLKQFEKIKETGVDLLLTDSTNANRQGFSPSETTILDPLEKIIKSTEKRVFITGFSSNLWRINIIVKVCKKIGRKLLVDGRGLRDSLELGKKFGYVEELKNVLIDEKQFKNTPDNKLVIVLSGSQGEHRSSLVRTSLKEHRFLSIKKDDLIIFSARPIPGNEREIIRLIDLLKEQGAAIITSRDHPDIHVSGHACAEDLLYFIKLLQPKCYVPIHGTYSLLADNQAIADHLQKQKLPSILIKNGDILEVLNRKVKKLKHHVALEREFVDQESYLPIGYKTLKDRLDIGELGLATVGGVVSKRNKKWIKGPQIQLVGLEVKRGVHLNNFLKKISDRLKNNLKEAISESKINQDDLRTECRLQVRRILKETFNKKVIVMSHIFVI